MSASSLDRTSIRKSTVYLCVPVRVPFSFSAMASYTDTLVAQRRSVVFTYCDIFAYNSNLCHISKVYNLLRFTSTWQKFENFADGKTHTRTKQLIGSSTFSFSISL